MIGNSTAWIATSTPPWGNVMTLQCKEAGHQSHEASITLIQQYGQRNIRIIKCRCKSWSSALISIGYWPSSPKQPQSAFDIKLMKTYSDFNLMCGTNTYNFSQLLKRISMTKYLSTQKEVYRPLIDSYRPFSAIYNRCLAGTTSLSDPIKVRCPACYYNLGKVHSATFDACFGTVGKMHQNRYPTSPFNANEYMMQDLSKEEVFQHSNEDDLSEKKSGCHRRSTRGPLQKANYYDGLNETGICGSVCKHGVPLYFINIRFGGEKKIFPSVILDKIMEERPNFQLLAKYDSMCVFETWRRVRAVSSILMVVTNFQLQNRDMKMPQINALSAGHSLTHEASCQAKYDPTRVLNNGLSSGEEIEANWAKMVSLQLRVREMSSANRHDELTEHLHHIASESVKSLGATLCRQYYKANKTLNHHMVLLRRYRAESGMSDEEALDWYKNYRMARIHKQNNMHLEALEQSRQNLIETNEDALYWLALMRTHDHHNYKTRVTLAQFVMNAVKKRKEALDSFNDIRKWEDPTSPTLTINQCADQGILGQEYFGDNHIEQPKYMHFDALQVVMRAREEIAYTITEIKSILVYASNELQRNRHLQQASADLADQSIRGMYTNNLMNLEKAAGIWISDLADVLHLQGLSSYAPDIKSIINDKTERSMPPGEMLPISDGESDWEKDAIV